MATTTSEHLFTFEEYLDYDDGTDNRYELVDGRLVLMNPPTFRHLLIAKFLERELDAEINRLGLAYLCFKEAGIRTGWRKSRLADVYVVTVEQVREALDESAISQTPPILAVEVVSPDSVKRDYRYKRCSAVLGVSPMSDCIKKRSEYAAQGILEYWIVDPIKKQVCVLLLEEGLYEETVFTDAQQLVSRTFPELSLTVEQILSAGSV